MATPAHTGRRTLAQQAARLRAAYPGGDVKLRPRVLTWTFTVMPTPMSREYTIELVLGERRNPKVNVLSPDLVAMASGVLPHVYRDGSLCLSQSGEWNDSMFVAETVVPWTIVWLAHFEVWLVDGDEWYGNVEPTYTVTRAPAPISADTTEHQNRAARRAAQRRNG